MPDNIDIPGFEKFIKALKETPETVTPFAVDAMTKSVRAVQARVDEYPPATEANQPGRYSTKTHRPMGYYERGRGWWYPVMKPWTVQAAGMTAGKAAGKEKAAYGKAYGVLKARKSAGVAGYKLAAGGTSEMLGKSWTVKVRVFKGLVTGEIGTGTSYADAVQGSRQAHYHAARGWTTIDTALAESEDDIQQFFSQAIQEWLESTAE